MRFRKFLKSNWFALVTIILTVIVFIGVVRSNNGQTEFIEKLRSFDLLWLLAAMLLIFVYWLFDAFTINIISRSMYPKFSFVESFKNAMIGLLYSALTPFATGGQPMQVYEMSKKGVKTGDGVSIIIVKSVIFQVGMILFAVLATIFGWSYFLREIDNFEIFVSLGFATNIIFVAALMLICLNVSFTKKMVSVFVRLLGKIRIFKDPDLTCERANTQMDVFKESLVRLAKNTRLIVSCMLTTMLQLCAFYIIPYCILRGFGVESDAFVLMMFTSALIMMITAFVPLPGGSGAAESSFYYFFLVFFDATLVFPALLIWRSVTYYSCIVMGAVVSVWIMLTDRKRDGLKNNTGDAVR